MSLPIEGQIGAGQEGSPLVKVSYMPEEGSGEPLNAQNPSPKNRRKPFSEKLVRAGLAASTLVGGTGLGIEASNKAQASNESGHQIQVNSQPNESVIQFERVDWVKDLKTVGDVTSPKEQSEALTASEAFINLAIKDPVNKVVNVPFFETTTDPQGNLNSIRVLGNPDASFPTNGWRSLKSGSSGGVFSKYADEVGPVSTKNNPATLHVVEESGVIRKVFISYEGGIKAMTFQEGGGVGSAEVEEIDVPGVIYSKVGYPERSLVIYSTMQVTTSQEKLLVVDTKTNKTTGIPVLIDGATIDPIIIKGKDGNIYCSALSASRNPYGYLKIVPNLDNLTISGERRHADVRSDNFYLDQSGSEEKALLYDRNRFVLRVYNETTNKLQSYNTGGLLNHLPGVYKDYTSIMSIASVDGRIYAGMSAGRPFLVSWPDNINPNDHPEMVSYVDLAEGFIDPEWARGTFVQSVNLTKREGRNLILMDIDYKGLVAVEAEADGSLKKEAPKYMLAEGVLKAESTPTPEPPATYTPTTNTPTPVGRLKEAFMPLVTRVKAFIGGW